MKSILKLIFDSRVALESFFNSCFGLCLTLRNMQAKEKLIYYMIMEIIVPTDANYLKKINLNALKNIIF